MKKALIYLLSAMLLMGALLQPLPAEAQQVDVDRKCSLSLKYSSYDKLFSGLDIRIYRVAEIYADGKYALTAPFDKYPVRINGITSQREWRDAANTLAAYAVADRVEPTRSQKTDSFGYAVFEDLKTGIYLVLGVTTEDETGTYRFENFCLFLPTPQNMGEDLYGIEAKPKSVFTPKPDGPTEPTEPGEPTEPSDPTQPSNPTEPVPPEEPKLEKFQLVKFWKDVGNRGDRPKEVYVDILKNGVVQKTVTLTAENNWSYQWSAPEGNDLWLVVERNVPDVYTVVIGNYGNIFTITNSRPPAPGTPPRTGDVFPLETWITIMSLSGILLLAIGIWHKRRNK